MEPGSPQARGAAAALSAGTSTRRLYRSILESQGTAPGVATQSRPNVDPQQQGAASLLSFNNTPRLVIATITDTTAIANCYRLQFEKAKQPMTAFVLADSSISAFGPRDLTTLQPGQAVLALLHDHLPHAIILGVLPPADIAADKATATVLLAASRSRVDEAHKRPLRTHGNGNIANWLAGRPFDLTTGGEKGWITETGLRICIDSFLAQLAVDESCGIFAFLHDQLLRVAGHNLQLWTAGMEQEGLLDGAEYNHTTGITPYPWEQLGMFAPGDPRRELSAEEWQIKNPHYAKWEPKDDKQMPWHRYREFQGYLGQGIKQVVQGPATGRGDGPNKYGTPVEHPLFFDSFTGLNGYHTLASASGISIVKRIGLVSPVRLQRPEQPDGDTSANYKFSGQTGDGPAHAIATEPTAEAEDASLQRIAGLLDLHAYLFNYAGTHPFFWHGKDWGLAQESELSWTEGKSLAMPDYAELASKMNLPPPQPLRIKVDHRYGEQDYYQTECGIDLLPDGSVVLYDGWGSELVMSGGSIKLRAAGDICSEAGRNVNLWAGFDAIVRAKNSADITVTEHDIRLKAEKNLQAIAGNGGTGGVLIESRASDETPYDFEKFGEDASYGGIILKAANTEVVSWAKNIYLRTGGGDVGAGLITLDANKGEQNITLHANTINEFVGEGVFQFFGTDGDITKANAFLESLCAICSPMFVNGTQVVAGDIVNKGSLIVTNGHIATEQAKSFNNLVGELKGESLRKANEAIQQVETQTSNDLPQTGSSLFSEAVTAAWYDAQRPGADDVISKGTFSLRSVAQYKTDDFKLYEARWQQMARLAEQELKTWEEKAVTSRGQEFYPYPGKEKFTGENLFRQDLTLFESSGCSKDRGQAGELADAYRAPKYAQPTAAALQTYSVIH